MAESECSYCYNQSLKEQYECIEGKYLDWKSWHTRGQDISMRTLAFSQLQNLQVIHLDNGGNDHNERTNLEPTDWASGIPVYFSHPPYNQCPVQWWNSDLYEVVVQAVRPLEHVDDVCQISPRSWRDDIRLLLGRFLVRISRNVEGKILVGNDIGSLELTSTYDSPHKRLFCGVLSVSSIDTCVPVEFCPTRVSLFFKGIRALHNLKLASSEDSAGAMSALSARMRYLLRCKSCSYLSSLDLSRSGIPQSTMIECLQAAAPTLRSLRLYRIVLSKGDWPSVFDQLGNQFRLDALSLQLCDFLRQYVEFSEKDVQDIRDWMCGRSDFHSLRLMKAHWVGY